MWIINQLKIRKRFYVPIIFFILLCYILAYFHPDVEIHYVYNMLPAMVYYTDNIKGGSTQSLLVRISKDNRKYENVLKHELIHIEQIYKSYFLYWIPLLLDKERTLARLEAEAYAPEIRSYKDIPTWAKFIQEEYAPSVDIKWIKEDLYKFHTRIKRKQILEKPMG